MRHLKAGRKFGRTSDHRNAMFRNMVTALLRRERIQTTLPKAKELRGKVERTITLGKKGTLHARRQAFKLVAEKDVVQKVFGPLAERFADRKGGYTRIIRIGNRRGDDAPMAYIELIGEDEGKKKDTPAKTKKKSKPTVTAESKKVEAKVEKKPVAEKKPATEKKTKTAEPEKSDAKEDK